MDQEKFEVRTGNDGWPHAHCQGCGSESPGRGLPDGHPGSLLLATLNAWASAHACGPALPPDTWLKAASVLRDALVPEVCSLPEPAVLARPLAAAMAAVWSELREAAAAERESGQ